MNYLYLPEDALIYDNIIEALDKKIIEKYGNPIEWDD